MKRATMVIISVFVLASVISLCAIKTAENTANSGSDNVVEVYNAIHQINDNVQLVLLQTKGTLTVSYKRTPTWHSWLTGATIKLEIDYTATFAIDTDKLDLQNRVGRLYVGYTAQDIQCIAIELDHSQATEVQQIMGKSFTADEILDIINIEKNRLKIDVVTDDAINRAEQNLKNYVHSLGVAVDFERLLPRNVKGFVEIQYNHPNQYREQTLYLVIHTTNNFSPTANAQAHYNYWDTTPDAKVSSHFVVDANEVIQCVDIDKIAWTVGRNPWMTDQAVFNNNSINIEMCNNINFDQAQARTIDLIQDHILPLYPNIQIVRHKDATGKENCPDMSDEEWEEFIQKVYGG